MQVPEMRLLTQMGSDQRQSIKVRKTVDAMVNNVSDFFNKDFGYERNASHYRPVNIQNRGGSMQRAETYVTISCWDTLVESWYIVFVLLNMNNNYINNNTPSIIWVSIQEIFLTVSKTEAVWRKRRDQAL